MRIFRKFSHNKNSPHHGADGAPRYEVGAGSFDFGYGAPYKQAWEHRRLPGAGANQWAWSTLALPLTTPIGAGTRNLRQFRATNSSPVMVAVQGITLTPLGGSPIQGDLTGEFVTQPLLDVTQAQLDGFMFPTNANAPQYGAPNANTLPAYSVG